MEGQSCTSPRTHEVGTTLRRVELAPIRVSDSTTRKLIHSVERGVSRRAQRYQSEMDSGRIRFEEDQKRGNSSIKGLLCVHESGDSRRP